MNSTREPPNASARSTHDGAVDRSTIAPFALETRGPLELVLEGSGVGYWDWNPKTNEAYSNARLTEMIGYPPSAEAPSVDWWESRIHPDDVASHRRAMAEHMSGSTSQYEHVHRLRHADGRWIHVLARARVFERDADGAPLRFCGTQTDITAEREAHRTAVEANTAKTQFLADVSHELRTPLTAVLGLSEALIEETFGELTPRQRRALVTIQESGRHLLALINDVLDIARVEVGKLSIDLQPTSVDALVAECTALVAPQVRAKGQLLAIEVAADLADIHVDRRRMVQVLLNLLDNAVKFSPRGATLTVRALPGALADARGSIAIHVADTGPGIAEHDLARVFEPFVTLDLSPTAVAHRGAGLGLALVKRLVELQGGVVRVETALGVGTTFIVDVPKADSPSRAPTSAPDPSRLPTVDSPVVLLAEDDESSIDTIRSYLESAGYRVRVARDGASAVTAAAERDVAVTLMDVRLPVLDGLGAIRRIRSNGGATQPIIALTAEAMRGDEERCVAAGATAYMSKPLRLRHLLELIETLRGGA